MQSSLSVLVQKIQTHYSKQNIYSNPTLIYNLNKHLQFPLSVIQQQLNEDHETLIKAIKRCSILEMVNQSTVRLKYPGLNRIVITKGFKKEAMEQILKGIPVGERTKIKKSSIIQGKSVFETDSEEAAWSLKKYLRVQKKRFDLSGDNGYKTSVNVKVRIIIEGEQLYTLLIDHLFQQERRFFILQQLNVDENIFVQPIVGQNYMEYNRKQESDEDISDITSRCSEVYSSKAMKEIIETSDTGTQLNETISEQTAKRKVSKKSVEESIFEEDEEIFHDQKENEDLTVDELKTSLQAQDIKEEQQENQQQNENIQVSEDLQEQMRPKNISLVVPPFNIEGTIENEDIQKLEQQKIQQHKNVYSYQALIDIYDGMIDNQQLEKPEVFTNYEQIVIKNQHKQKFLDGIFNKISRGKPEKGTMFR